ncbi:MAG: hypothetical protein QOJ29_2993, partial [Thermoleophilaceae bacterium]|nr:hypothetical protein [Thermoleophilaceae bacterium]
HAALESRASLCDHGVERGDFVGVALYTTASASSC